MSDLCPWCGWSLDPTGELESPHHRLCCADRYYPTGCERCDKQLGEIRETLPAVDSRADS